jgi:molybdopterin molybdotransferase
VKIMTGAIMPAGLDTVVPQEFTTAQGDQITIAPDVLRLGDNRRFKGEDLMEGGVALARGELLTPAALGLVASLGLKTVTVSRRLRVAYFSTGDEILSLGEPPREGAVYDSNRYTVFGLLTRLGVEVIDMGVVRDDPALLEAAFTEAAQRADAIITSGGVSVGEADHTRAMMKKLGDVAFWRIAMRPGRPMAVGRIAATGLQAKTAPSAQPASAGSYQNDINTSTGGAVLFGLPGNPVAVMVTFLAFVRPALLRMMGSTRTAPPLLRATSTEAIRKKPGRTEYQRGTVTTGPDGNLQVRTTGNQGSGVLSSMVQANGLIVLHHHQGNVAVGDAVDVMVFEGVISGFFARFLHTRAIHRLFRRMAMLESLAGTSISREMPDVLGKTLTEAARAEPADVLRSLASHADGLTEPEARAALRRAGPNEVEHEKPLPWWQHLWHCYRNPFNLLLTRAGRRSPGLTDDTKGATAHQRPWSCCLPVCVSGRKADPTRPPTSSSPWSAAPPPCCGVPRATPRRRARQPAPAQPGRAGSRCPSAGWFPVRCWCCRPAT